MNRAHHLASWRLLLSLLLALSGLLGARAPIARAEPMTLSIPAYAPEGARASNLSVGQLHACVLTNAALISCWGLEYYNSHTTPSGTFTQVATGGFHVCGLKTGGVAACWGGGTAGTSDANGEAHYGQSVVPSGTFVQLSGGYTHTCGLKSDSTLACWGAGATNTGSSPHYGQSIAPSGTFVQVSAGAYHSCGIKTDRTLACWGWNSSGQSTPPSGTFARVDAGYQHSCGLKTDGTLACWGAGTTNTGSNPNYGQSIAPSGSYIDIAAGQFHTCGIKADRSLNCWGRSNSGQLGFPSGTYLELDAGFTHNCAVKTDGSIACWGDSYSGKTSPPAGSTYLRKAVEAGSFHTCAIKASGDAGCWGAGADSSGDPHFGQSIAPAGTFLGVSAGYGHSCGVKSDSSLACWGRSSYSQITPPAGTFLQVSVGDNHSCALTTARAVSCWGDNRLNQTAASGDAALQVSAGGEFTCMLKTTGALGCWGLGNDGRTSPPSGSFVQLSAGSTHSCAIKTTGALACWGNSGDGKTTPPSGSFAQVSAGYKHSCAIKVDGSISCWGSNTYGQTGAPSGTFVQLSAGAYHTCAIRLDDAMLCWGAGATSAAWPHYGQGPQPAITPATLPDGQPTELYSQQMAFGGPSVGTATYAISGGGLPSPLSLSGAGLVSGTPGAVGSSAVSISASDDFGFAASRSYTLVINGAPTPNAGPDQTVGVGAAVQLTGAASSDAQGNTPLAYAWVQTGGTAVTLNSASAASPTFAAPAAPSRLIFELYVTDSRGLTNTTPDIVQIYVQEIAIAGLSIAAASPTWLGSSTSFAASLSAGTNVAYSWDFGDGSAPASGASAGHIYPAAGIYTATLTATNPKGSATRTALVRVTDVAPGGVGSGLSLWLSAASFAPATGAITASWADLSGHATQLEQTSSAHQPLYQAAAVNGQPVLKFDSTDYLARTMTGSQLFDPSQNTLFFAKQSAGGGVWFKWQTSNSNRVGFELAGNKTRFDIPNDAGGQLIGGTQVTDRFHLVTGRKDATTQSLFLDGAPDGSKSNSSSLSLGAQASLTIGKNPGGSLGWNGTIGEVIVYGRALSAGERNRVESYLALKYGLTLGSATAPLSYTDSAGATIWDAGALAAYHNGVAGIGRDDTSGLDLRTSRSTTGDILSVAGVPFSDGAFLLWGNNAITPTSVISQSLGDLETTRLARVWRVQETGATGPLTVSVDLGALGAGYDPAALALLIDDDGDFGDAALFSGGRSVSQGVVSFGGVDLADGQHLGLLLSGQAPLDLELAGDGAGSVTSSPAGIDCAAACSALFGLGSAVTLTAAPQAGSVFVGWGGACAGSAGPTCQLSLSEARAVSATFAIASAPAYRIYIPALIR